MSTTTTDHSDTPADQHREKRREANWLTQVECPAGHTLGRAANVSLGGLLVQTSTTFAPRTEVMVRFHLRLPPNTHFIESRGLVVHEEAGARMGIQFLQLQDSVRLALRNYVYGQEKETQHGPD